MIFDNIRYKLYTFVYGKGLPSHILKRSGFQDELIEVINMIQENNKKNIICKEAIKKIDEIMEQYEYPYYTAGPDGKPKEIRKKRRSVNCR